MQKYNEYQKIVALLLSAIIMLEFSGCFSVRDISKREIQYSLKKYYFIHGNNAFYRINNVNISDGILSGKLDSSTSTLKSQSIHIYVAPDSSIVKTGNIISLPYANIAKVEAYKADAGKSITFGLATAYSAFFVGALVTVLIRKKE